MSYRFKNGEKNRKRGLSRSVLCSRQDRSISWIVQIDGVTIKSLQRTDAGRKRNVRFVINGPRHYSHTNVKCILLFAEDIFLQISSAPEARFNHLLVWLELKRSMISWQSIINFRLEDKSSDKLNMS